MSDNLKNIIRDELEDYFKKESTYLAVVEDAVNSVVEIDSTSERLIEEIMLQLEDAIDFNDMAKRIEKRLKEESFTFIPNEKAPFGEVFSGKFKSKNEEIEPEVLVFDKTKFIIVD